MKMTIQRSDIKFAAHIGTEGAAEDRPFRIIVEDEKTKKWLTKRGQKSRTEMCRFRKILPLEERS